MLMKKVQTQGWKPTHESDAPSHEAHETIVAPSAPGPDVPLHSVGLGPKAGAGR